MNKTIQAILIWVIALAVPFFLLIASVRILFTPPSVQLEYNMPGFPEDRYGFTKEERMRYARVSLDYLFNNEGIEFLAEQQLADGTPLYTERELSHMVDVKIFFRNLTNVWWIAALVLLSLGIWAAAGKWLPVYARGLGTGGMLTIGLILFTLLLVAISFNQLFTLFHQLFFEGDSWLFYYSDSLIRLFPIRLWQDVFIATGVLTILGAGILIWIGRKFGR